MPKSRRPKPLYQRGGFKLFPRDGRNHEIVWYDPIIGRERGTSAGTTDVDAAKAALDREYWKRSKGLSTCPTCGQSVERGTDEPKENGNLVTNIMEAYLVSVDGRESEGAIIARLAHIGRYIAVTDPAVTHDRIDEAWIKGFRKWNLAQPIVSPTGVERQRAISTVENSVLQLAAALRHSKISPLFEVAQPKEVNQTPQFRADIPTIAKALRYCLAAEDEKRSDEWRARRIGERAQLLRFLRLSIVSLARPDAAHDVSTAPDRKQWNSERRILSLNPAGRRQTKKCRAIIPVARQFAPHLDEAQGPYIEVESVKKVHEKMAATIGLPGDGESGMKLWRRSMADLLRSRLPVEAWGEIEIFMGHDVFDEVTSLYAPFRPDYLRRALAEIETIIDELEALAPGAFYRDLTAQGGNVASIMRGKNG
jgi:hypothetical protein